MLTRAEFRAAQARAARILARVGIALTPAERKHVEVADFGLGDLKRSGLELVVYENNDRYCAKELVLFPGQTCPEHRHPPVGRSPGKRETFRCRSGEVFLYVEGKPARRPRALPPRGRERWYRARHEVRLRPGEQYTIPPDTWHWFRAGRAGAVVSEFSSTSTDRRDVFRDPAIRRKTKVY